MRARLRCNVLRLGAGGQKTLFCRRADEGRLSRQMHRNLVVASSSHRIRRGAEPVRGVLGIGLGFVFGSQFEKTFLRHKVVGATHQAAASVCLLSEKKGLRHGPLARQGGSPFSGSQSPMPEAVCGDS